MPSACPKDALSYVHTHTDDCNLAATSMMLVTSSIEGLLSLPQLYSRPLGFTRAAVFIEYSIRVFVLLLGPRMQ